jgi:hypothetical protein
MLTAKITPRGGGFHLAGDHLDLETLHSSLHAICEDDSDGSSYPENLIFQLAYDVRKASGGHRDRIKVESFGRKTATYHSVTVSVVRAAVQFAFLVCLIRGKSIPLQHTASIHAFGAALASALEQLKFPSPEAFIAAVARSVDGWPDWPPSFLVDRIDLQFLYEHRTRQTRLLALKNLPECLRHGGPYAKRQLKARADAAAKQGVDPASLEPDWPDAPPKY